MLQKKIISLLIVLSVCVFIFGTGYKLGEYKSYLLTSGSSNSFFNLNNYSQAQKTSNLNFALFWDAWDKVQSKFIDRNKLAPTKMFYGAIKGMVASAEDPYTFFLTPDENKQSKDDLGGKFEGIGAQLGLKDSRIVVIAPLKNSPAQKAGIVAGDFINKVNNQSTKNWTLPQTVTAIRGEKGTKVTLTLERNSKEFNLTLVRDQIMVDSIELTYESSTSCQSSCPKIAYLKLNQFSDTTNDEWDKAVDEIQSKWKNGEIKGMVLDLRDNPGGYLDSAVYLASDFLPNGKVVVKQESTAADSKNYYVIHPGKLLDIPVDVLINKGSASASEILAGALRDYHRAKLIGEKSFGKGSVQEALDLRDGAGLHVTVAKWILPNGDWINEKGIDPDIKVENPTITGNTLTKNQDIQLEKAIELIIQ